jgi:hypothetical protein
VGYFFLLSFLTLSTFHSSLFACMSFEEKLDVRCKGFSPLLFLFQFEYDMMGPSFFGGHLFCLVVSELPGSVTL